jgi:hypothetical protein
LNNKLLSLRPVCKDIVNKAGRFGVRGAAISGTLRVRTAEHNIKRALDCFDILLQGLQAVLLSLPDVDYKGGDLTAFRRGRDVVNEPSQLGQLGGGLLKKRAYV